MEKVSLRDGEEFIKLGQAMKKAGCVGSGVDAKMMIQEGDVLVNNEPEDRRGRKLFENDTFSFEGVTYQVVKEWS